MGTRSEKIFARVTKENKLFLMTRSAELGVTMSDYLQMMLTKVRKKNTDTPNEEVDDSCIKPEFR